jgi:hypothetical protein
VTSNCDIKSGCPQKKRKKEKKERKKKTQFHNLTENRFFNFMWFHKPIIIEPDSLHVDFMYTLKQFMGKMLWLLENQNYSVFFFITEDLKYIQIDDNLQSNLLRWGGGLNLKFNTCFVEVALNLETTCLLYLLIEMRFYGMKQ